VIEGNAQSRSIIVAQLRELGVGTVMQCSRVHDARRKLETQRFDVVICEQSFERESYSGQDLLDDLRRNQLLPFYTVFIMLTAEASYSKVAEAAESALDAYLLKPHTGARLAETHPAGARSQGANCRVSSPPSTHRTSSRPPRCACRDFESKQRPTGCTPPGSAPSCCCAPDAWPKPANSTRR
jgi:CheY-like chemotaxis protein